jgi:hypothetical protein
MKRILLLLLMGCSLLQLYGQGTVQLTSGTNIKTTGGIYLVLDNMHLVNNGNLQQSDGNGTVKFIGSNAINFSGSGATTINHLFLSKGSNSQLNLQSNISVTADVNFQGGLINLGNSHIDLGNTGLLTGESESSRATTTGSGYIQASGTLNAPGGVNPGNLGAIITSATNLGATTIRRGHAVQNNIFGTNPSIGRYYDILPANNTGLNATLRFRYFDAELNGLNEATLSLWKSMDNTTWKSIGYSSKDATANYVEKTGISDFSRWTLGTATPPSITCPQNITVDNDAGLCSALVSLTGSRAATATGIPTPVITYKIGQATITSPYAFPVGTTTVTVIASNGILPDATCSFTVSVHDKTPPSITGISATPATLAPPNHKMSNVTVNYTLKDNCGGTVTTSLSVSSNEPQNGTGDGDTSPDWLIVDNHHVQLRAERSGQGNGRIYTITIKAIDGAGNQTIKTVAVVVPHNTSAPVTSNSFKVDSTVARATEAKSLTVNAHPNPTANYFTLVTRSSSNRVLTLRVIDVEGHVIENRSGVAANGSIRIGHQYRPGTYFVQVVQGNQTVTLKLIKQSD